MVIRTACAGGRWAVAQVMGGGGGRRKSPTLILQPEKGKSYGRVQRSLHDVLRSRLAGFCVELVSARRYGNVLYVYKVNVV